jgi:RNA polymerase sigma factor (sigma-70 family)
VEAGRAVTDAQLLEEFNGKGSEEAFRELVSRYSGLVYSACLRRLGNPHDAEDAAQAVFITLARKARGVRGKSLASWLHRAAGYVSMRRHRDRALRQKREREVVQVAAGESSERESRAWEDVRPALDGAVQSLPSRYRQVVVLHYLAGRPVAEVAAALGKPAGTVKSLLSRGVEKLRAKLSRLTGTQLSVGVLAAALAERAVEAVPAGLVESSAAMAAGTAAISSGAASLAEGLASSLVWAKAKMVAVLVCSIAAAGGAGTLAVRGFSSSESASALAPDPEVLRILDSLKSGQSALLPPVRTAGDLNAEVRKWGLHETGPCGRNFSVKGVWMPDRRRAIFAGANAKVPHRLNDVWEYDLPSNTWNCLYGPDASMHWGGGGGSDMRLVDGVLRTERGGPVIIGQAWGHVAYDPELPAMLFMNVWPGVGPTIKKRYIETGLHDHKPPLWVFYPQEGRWEPIRSPGPNPAGYMASCFDHVSQLGGCLLVSSGPRASSVWLYRSRANRWERQMLLEGLPRQRAGKFPRSNCVSAVCADRGILVLVGGEEGNGRTWHYDMAAGSWRLAAEGPELPSGSPSFTPFAYDSASKVCLLLDIGGEARGLHAYDPGTCRWTELDPRGPPVPDGPKPIAYYDPARNAFVVNRGRSVWVYRHTR